VSEFLRNSNDGIKARVRPTLEPLVEAIAPPTSRKPMYGAYSKRGKLSAERGSEHIGQVPMRMENIGLRLPAYLPNQSSLCSESTSGMDDPNNWDTGLMEFDRKWRLRYTALQQHDDSDIVSGSFLARCQGVNDTFEAAESSRGEKVENLQRGKSGSIFAAGSQKSCWLRTNLS
jgi:hypothetical protein